MDKSTRALLRSAVTRCRATLEESLGQVLEGEFGVHSDGHIESDGSLPQLDAGQLADRRILISNVEHVQARGVSRSDAVTQVIREAAFTHLNRLCAYKLLERRKLIREAASRGIESTGFKFYLADRPQEEFLWASGRGDLAYRHFLKWLAESLSSQIGVLFSTDEVANYLPPPHTAILAVLELINDPKLERVWDEDETIGWIYQYFTPDEDRRQARKESSAPRDGHELAFLNQFYTPRYVVEFLVQNTLGRLWYDMMRGNTALIRSCRHLEYTPGEWRDVPKKDPRRLRIMDPACGSGHFLLHSFDLMLKIYEEAHADPDLGPDLARDYPTVDSLRAAAPALIMRNNLYGMDIDSRATQIAALALWLRAQRAYSDAGVEGDKRPEITKANIICAEPMPGEADMLEQFLSRLETPALRPLVRKVFQRMEPAGELGSLLKIDDEIRDVVDEAKERLKHSPTAIQQSLFAGEKRAEHGEQMELALFAMSPDEFWAEAEARIVESLRRYAEANGSSTGASTKKLFAGDAGRGFAFVDACRKQYDVVLMNPPFGQPSVGSKQYMADNYPVSKHDIACAFVQRWLEKCEPTGRLGAITTRTPFFLSSSTAWREEVALKDGKLRVFADLGFGVLDAMVETAAYVLAKSGSDDPTLFIRALGDEDKASALHEAISNREDAKRFSVYPASFAQVPNSPLCYWVSDHVRRLFQELPPFESERRTVKQGLATADDFRFVRLWTEVSPEKIGTKWFPFAKGGAYSPYYADLHLVVNWENEGEEIRALVDPVTGRQLSRPQNTQFYFQPGLTWPLRTNGISFRVMPEGCIFGHKGPAAFGEMDDLLAVCAVANSRAFGVILSCLLARTELAQSYEVGLIKQMPMPGLGLDRPSLAGLARKGFAATRELASVDEISHTFAGPGCTSPLPPAIGEIADSLMSHRVRAQSQLHALIDEIDVECERQYDLGDEDFRASTETGDLPTTQDAGSDDDAITTDDGSNVEGIPSEYAPATAAHLLSWALGVAFGRWDVRLATGQSPVPPLPDDPFAPLPKYSPGMLIDPVVLAGKADRLEYPVGISADGILVDDPESPDDAVGRVRDVLEAIWHERADDIESEACEILGVSDLRDYFRDPKLFFDHHTKQYSRSRRKAPIYWLLQSPRRSYGVWLYYHRLNRDTLPKVLAMHVEPKIRLEQARLDQMRAQRKEMGAGGSEAKRMERAIDRHEALMSDLHAFRDRLRRAAELYLEPDLDDGVVLNMAPLWELVPWKEPGVYWEALRGGEYAWSGIAKQLARKG
ncbi:MAG: BREX-1 system adenine-specific DNA-methyltransferase PglX [Firmicutes bacterium]|nr:BREX-1 system adenine-specific DNA-methyltransferase PglX [Bacillota bacterium]